MAKKSKSHKKKRLKTLIIILIIILLAALAAFFAFRPDLHWSGVEETEEVGALDITEPTAHTSNSGLKVQSDNTPVQYEGEDPNNSSNITGAITYASSDESGNAIISVVIDQFLNSGTCDLTLTKSGVTKKYSAPIVNLPSTSSCDGFTIPGPELSSGTWQILVTVKADDKTGKITGELHL